MPFIGTIISAKLHLCQVTEIIFIMMTSSNGNIFRVTGSLCGEFTGPGEFPTQRPVTRSFDVFFDLRLNKRLSKQPWGWWFETPSWSLWRHFHDRLLSSPGTWSSYVIFGDLTKSQLRFRILKWIAITWRITENRGRHDVNSVVTIGCHNDNIRDHQWRRILHSRF